LILYEKCRVDCGKGYTGNSEVLVVRGVVSGGGIDEIASDRESGRIGVLPAEERRVVHAVVDPVHLAAELQNMTTNPTFAVGGYGGG
jgi:hypothetical protein